MGLTGQQLDYATPPPRPPGRRGFAAGVMGSLAVLIIAIFLASEALATTTRLRFWYASQFVGLIAVVLAGPLLFVGSGIAAIAASVSPRTKPDYLLLAWLMVFLQSCFWGYIAWWIAHGGLALGGAPGGF